MRPIFLLTLSLGIPLAFGLGLLVARPASRPSPTEQDIARMQTDGDAVLPPLWRTLFLERPWLKAIRRRGYIYCNRHGAIDIGCAREQDEAMQGMIFALMTSKWQQGMTDRNQLSQREFEVARDPALRSKVIRYCARLYDDHGSQDARLLAVCLGNLSDYSLLVPIPVP